MGRGVACLGEPCVDRCQDQVFQELGVAIGDQLGVDIHGDDLEPAAYLDGHRAAAGASFYFELAERFNRLAQLASVFDQFREHTQLIEHVVLLPSRVFEFRAGAPLEPLKQANQLLGPVRGRPFPAGLSVFIGRRVVLVVIHLDRPGLEQLEQPLNQRVF
jgi:hypothetical protein